MQTLAKPLAEEVDLSGCVDFLRKVEPLQIEMGYTVYLANVVPIIIGLLRLGTQVPLVALSIVSMWECENPLNRRHSTVVVWYAHYCGCVERPCVHHH